MSGNSGQEEKDMERAENKTEEKDASEESDSKNDVSKDSSAEKEESADKEESDEESDKSENNEVGLLDRPVEVSGVRERKKVQRLEYSINKTTRETAIAEGSGDKLGQCPRIESNISKNTFNDLKILHKILFNKFGTSTQAKKNIRKFNGFPFTKGSAEYDKKKAIIAKTIQGKLKQVCGILDLERGGTKEEVVVRILDFLLEPKPSDKKVMKGKKKSVAKVSKKTKGKKKVEKTSKVSDGSGSSSDSSDVKSDEESEEEEKPKKKATIPEKNVKGKQRGRPPKKLKPKVESSDASSDDDEPLVKKDSDSSSTPTEEDIKKVIEGILKESDLHEITMNKVIQKVFDAFPDHDLKHKKDFIKTVVKSGI